jgi:ribosome maturation factor RimP
MTPFERQLTDLLEPVVTRLGFELVRLSFGGGQRPVLQIMAERPDGTMTIEGCETISRAVSALLEEQDPITDAYRLEVSSPGIDRPLTRPKDFSRWAGHEARLETAEPVDGRKRFSGTLEGLDADDQVVIATETGTFHLPRASLTKAKLVLTDALIAAARPAVEALNPPEGLAVDTISTER